MQRLPTVRKLKNGYCFFDPTAAAKRVCSANLLRARPFCAAPEVVRNNAEKAARENGFSNPNLCTVRGFYRLQLGKYHGQTFHWLMENDMGWATYLITGMEAEGGNTGESPLNRHKHELKAYMESLEDGLAALAQRRRANSAKQQQEEARKKRQMQPNVTKPTKLTCTSTMLPPSATVSTGPVDEMGDDDLVQVVEMLEASHEFPALVQASQSKPAASQDVSPATQPQSRSETATLGGNFNLRTPEQDPLPRGWKNKLPEADHHWVSKALVRHTTPGHVEVQPQQLWYYPPQPKPVLTGVPKVDRYACDISVITLLRTRGYGNSASQLRRKLVEEHSQDWMTRVIHYMSDCKVILDSGLFPGHSIAEPPQMLAVPHSPWLQTVYCHDILSRIDEIKAAITSTFGNVLKMDSTKKVTKKLAGQSRGTATWASDIGNEYGQVLMCVLTSREGYGLTEMVHGVIKRYELAGEAPPKVLYVDRDCCGDSEIFKMFRMWPDMQVRLDIWHFMRRFAMGVSTDAHILYPMFMSRLSKAIFEWNQDDVDLLKKAKRAELEKHHHKDAGKDDISRWLTKYELAKYCRRRTRGVEETTRLLGELIESLMGDEGKDTCGVPLFDNEMMSAIWARQRRHVACIQDPEGLSLYTSIGTGKKGGVELTKFRCARGSVSLESFHNHLAKFIPGTSASDAHFQAYLLEGLMRWNQDRDRDTKEGANYSGSLQHQVNKLSSELLQRNLITDFRSPRAYTGEKIGLEYLYAQNKQMLPSIDPDDEDTVVAEPGPSDSAPDIDDDLDEGFEEDDATIPPVEQVLQEDTEHRPVRLPSPTLLVADPVPTSARPALSAPTVRSTKEHVPVRAHSPVQPVVAPVPTLPSTPTGNNPPEQLEHNDAIGPDSVGGYDRVENLVEFLFKLKDQQSALTNIQAESIVALWGSLTPFDQQPTTPKPRHRIRQVGLSAATYRRKSMQSVVPGVDAVNRTMRGASDGPAQRPDASRVMACLVVKLCNVYRSPEKRGQQRVERWTLVTTAYRNIRQLLTDNETVMKKTRIQLFNINNATLSQWYNERIKTHELAILSQGLTQSEPSLVATTGTFPEPIMRVPVSERPRIPAEQQHRFVSLPNQTGLANTRRRIFKPAESPANPESVERRIHSLIQDVPVARPPPATDPVPMFKPGYTPPADSPAIFRNVFLPDPSLSKSTRWYQNKKQKKLSEGQDIKLHVRQREHHMYTCRKCGQLRSPPDHTQYYGSWFCAKTSSQTVDEWRMERKLERINKKAKKQ